MQGRIKFFNRTRRYGIITIEDGQAWFFHETGIVGAPVTADDLCTFDLVDDPRACDDQGHPKMMAANVEKIGTANEEPPPDPCRLFIANLNYSTAEADLDALASAYAPLESVELVRDKITGESRGFGFIQTQSAKGALNLIAKLHGIEVSGRRISVRFAQRLKDRM